MEDTKTNKVAEVDLGHITLEVYNYIAMWHNEDFSTPKLRGDALKVVSHQIVKEVLETAFESIGLKNKTEVTRGGTQIKEDMTQDELDKLTKEAVESEKKKMLDEIIKQIK